MAGKHSMPISKYLILLLNLPRFVATITQEHFKISYITIKPSCIAFRLVSFSFQNILYYY